MKILDPACGSGSFLLGAYHYLIDYHLEYYRKHPKEAQTEYFDFYLKIGPEDMALPLRTKAKILRNNIFGVDIDPQAVEITMMSLYLKALEGERGLLPKKQHLLPPLSNNIKCGNSLIGYDILDQGQLYEGTVPELRAEGRRFGTVPDHGGFSSEDKSRINPFDWKSKTAGFGEIMHPSQSPLAKGGIQGGFDVVIGNPPYVRQEMIAEFKDYFQNHYEVYHGTADLYAYFIEKGVSLLRKDGLFSYIVANKWMRSNYGEPLRRWMKKQRIEEITDFGDLPVFESATTYPCILRIRKGSPASKFFATDVKTLDFSNLADYVREHSYTVNRSALSDGGWALVDEQSQALLNKLQSVGKPLGEYVGGKIYRGILTGLNEAFVLDAETRKQLITDDPDSSELIKPFLAGKDIKRYESPEKGRYLILIPRGWTREQISHTNVRYGTTETGAWKWLNEHYPPIAAHLAPFAEKGKKRFDKGEYWWELRACDYYEEFEKPKLMLPDISVRGNFTLDKEGGFFSANTSYVIGSDDKYLLGILNSTLMTFYYKNSFASYRGGYLRFFTQYIEQLPIRTIDFNNPAEKEIHDKLVSLVDRMLELHKKKNALPPSAEREKIEREIASTDEKIDELVYGLYGVTEEERGIIEGK